MENSLIFTGLILLAGLAGGLIGSACGRKRNEPDAEVDGRIADLEDRLDALADHVMDQTHAIREMVNEHELLIGETPNDGLLGRVGALEEARRKEGPKLLDLTACVDAQGEKLDEIRKDVETMRTVYDEQFRVLPKALAVGPVEQRVDTLEKTQRVLLAADKSNVAYLNRLDERVAGVEAMLVSTVGKETEGFCKSMDAVMDKMEGQDG